MHIAPTPGLGHLQMAAGTILPLQDSLYCAETPTIKLTKLHTVLFPVSQSSKLSLSPATSEGDTREVLLPQ